MNPKLPDRPIPPVMHSHTTNCLFHSKLDTNTISLENYTSSSNASSEFFTHASSCFHILCCVIPPVLRTRVPFMPCPFLTVVAALHRLPIQVVMRSVQGSSLEVLERSSVQQAYGATSWWMNVMANGQTTTSLPFYIAIVKLTTREMTGCLWPL